jgi:hypothetical protein
MSFQEAIQTTAPLQSNLPVNQGRKPRKEIQHGKETKTISRMTVKRSFRIYSSIQQIFLTTGYKLALF